jgi:hypothetical protein
MRLFFNEDLMYQSGGKSLAFRRRLQFNPFVTAKECIENLVFL